MFLTPMELGALRRGTLVKAVHREVPSLVYMVEIWTDEHMPIIGPDGSIVEEAMNSMSWQQLVHCPRLAGKTVYGHAWINGRRSKCSQNFPQDRYTFERLTPQEEEEIALFVLARI